jgi:hypothetical protein
MDAFITPNLVWQSGRAAAALRAVREEEVGMREEERWEEEVGVREEERWEGVVGRKIWQNGLEDWWEEDMREGIGR